MFDHKIIFTGPVGSGKTTAVHTYSEIEPVMTEVKATDSTKNKKESTTVALDYGAVTLDEETKIHLYGTPGQERFEFMWDILGTGSHGLVLLIDHTDPDPLSSMRFYLEKFSQLVKSVPFVVGINKFDSPAPHSLAYEDYVEAAHQFDPNIEVFNVDIRKEEDVRMLIMVLLFAVPRDIHDENDK
ncbi:MAG: ATP/GTP-binding protein [Neisseriaceae bacterium]|nr:ATP/GTP-binding protein [Neisseriaceae bacterium]